VIAITVVTAFSVVVAPPLVVALMAMSLAVAVVVSDDLAGAVAMVVRLSPGRAG
jgi:hypothetical protein